jgi:hypothetical protein
VVRFLADYARVHPMADRLIPLAEPLCCRSFPVFRMAEGSGEPRFYLQEVSCPAAETEREHTVAQWIGQEGLAAYHREND